jgi:hypothetical protein
MLGSKKGSGDSYICRFKGKVQVLILSQIIVFGQTLQLFIGFKGFEIKSNWIQFRIVKRKAVLLL